MNISMLGNRSRFGMFAVFTLLMWGMFVTARAQDTSGETPGASATDASPISQGTIAAEGASGQDNLTMPAPQLIELLRDSPEIMTEVRSLVADASQQTGVSVQADALTDEQVYSQIAQNKELRASVTQFLRARGYLSETEIQAANEKDLQIRARTSALEGKSMSARSIEISKGQGYDRRPDNSDETREPPNSFSMGVAPGHTIPSTAPEPNITDGPTALHRQAPYNLLSLRDLYTQAPNSAEHLRRFGIDLLTEHNATGNRSIDVGSSNSGSALDVPLGPDYVLGPGDELSLALWGGISQNLLRVIDREGRIALPEAGMIQVAGLTIAKSEALITEALQSQYRNLHVALTLSRLRSIRIFVVGDVLRPGSYELSALASPLSALFAAGGPKANGSLRVLRHFRNDKLVGEIDLYDFMLHGVRPGDDRLQGGDTLLVPPVGPQVAIYGAVKRPAIYELITEKELGSVFDLAGGFTVAAALTNITIDRMIANQHREEISLAFESGEDVSAVAARLRSTSVLDGDRVHVGTILPHEQRAIYLQGHFARPGKIAYWDNMRLHDVLRSYEDLLPEPADRGEIVRLVEPDLHPETIDFSVPDVLAGNGAVQLQPYDTINVFGRYERDAPTVSIRGEVQKPGTYPLFRGMTAAQLVRVAGGFKRDALVTEADLASYQVLDGTKVSIQRRDVAIGDAVLKPDRNADEPLRAGDVLTIHQLTGWSDIGASIIIEGEVAHPGSYGFQEGEHLSEVLRRAGGFRPTAYPEGAVLTRPDVATLEAKSRDELIRQIETSSAAARISPISSGEQTATAQILQRQQDEVLARLRNQPVTGRMVIHIDAPIESWAGTAADIEIRSGDLLRIPKRPGFVLVSGQVYNPSAITFIPGKSARWYLEHAGGATSIANRKEIFVIRSNGDVIGRRSGGWYERDVLSTKLNAGDTVVVPQKITGPSVTWRNLLGTAQIATSIAIAAAVAGL